jgi:hypothetical protein
MLLKAWRFITIIFVSLSMGMAFSHLLQMPPRMSYDALLWRATQSMYELFGPPVGAIIEGGAVLSSVALAFLVRGRRPAFQWTVVGAGAVVAAHLIYWVFVFPVNAVMIHWTPDTIPADWTEYRNQWEYAHAARALLQIIGFAALVMSVITETPRRAGDRPVYRLG